MRGDLVDQQVGVEIAGQQRRLEEEHRHRPHRRRPAQHRQHHLGEHGLDGEQQERREEGRGGGSTSSPGRSWPARPGTAASPLRRPCRCCCCRSFPLLNAPSRDGQRRPAPRTCPNPAPAAALPGQLNASTFQDFVGRPMLELLVRQGWLIDKRHCPTPQGRRLALRASGLRGAPGCNAAWEHAQGLGAGRGWLPRVWTLRAVRVTSSATRDAG